MRENPAPVLLILKLGLLFGGGIAAYALLRPVLKGLGKAGERLAKGIEKGAPWLLGGTAGMITAGFLPKEQKFAKDILSYGGLGALAVGGYHLVAAAANERAAAVEAAKLNPLAPEAIELLVARHKPGFIEDPLRLRRPRTIFTITNRTDKPAGVAIWQELYDSPTPMYRYPTQYIHLEARGSRTGHWEDVPLVVERPIRRAIVWIANAHEPDKALYGRSVAY